MKRSYNIECLARASGRGDIVKSGKCRTIILYIDAALGTVVAALRVSAVIEHLGKEALDLGSV